jgi:hypothetical protein
LCRLKNVFDIGAPAVNSRDTNSAEDFGMGLFVNRTNECNDGACNYRNGGGQVKVAGSSLAAYLLFFVQLSLVV